MPAANETPSLLTGGMALSRWKALIAGWELGLRLRRLRRREAQAHERVGRSFRGVPAPSDAAWAEPVSSALARIVALEEHGRALAERQAASFETDRRDYRATDADLGRCLVVVRGILDRLIVRDEAWSARRELPGRYVELGARVMADVAASEALPAEERRGAVTAEQLLRDAVNQRDALLALRGEPLPNALRVLLGEFATFFGFLWEELTKRVYLRLPGLAAMGTAWWVTNRFTSSRLEGNVSRLMAEGRTGVSQEALEWLSFALPLIVAALVAYLLATLTKHVERRYGSEVPSTKAGKE